MGEEYSVNREWGEQLFRNCALLMKKQNENKDRVKKLQKFRLNSRLMDITAKYGEMLMADQYSEVSLRPIKEKIEILKSRLDLI